MMLNCSANSDQRPINKKSPHYFVFTRWMGSWERDFSIWSNPFYSEALLCYVGKIYQQQANVYHFFNQLWQESFRSSFDELDLLHFLIERLSRRPGIKTTIKNRQETSRIESRLNELKSILMQDENSRFQIRWKSTKHQNIDLQSIETYLDFGCGNGLISSNLGKFLKLKREQIFVCDVFNSENDDVTFVPINKTTGKIDLGEKRVDLISCLVTLHHLENLDEILGELSRIVKENGFLLIREHDCRLERSLDTKYLNFVHAIMMIARIGEFSDENLPACEKNLSWPEEKRKIIDYTKSIHYRTRKQWNEKLQSFGFELVATFDYDRKKTKNPQQLFYALYKRTDENSNIR